MSLGRIAKMVFYYWFFIILINLSTFFYQISYALRAKERKEKKTLRDDSLVCSKICNRQYASLF